MRSFTLVFLVALSAPLAEAQATKYWVFLAHPPAETARISVSPHAAERRSQRGGRVPARADVPVAASHLDALRALGIEPVVASRWFNAVSAALTPAEAATVRALPFVRGLRPVGRTVTERAGPVSPVRIDYGPSAQQIDLINARGPLDAGVNGAGVVVGFLDTTFDFQHPALAHLVEQGRLLEVRDFTGQAQANTHGLSVASVAVGFDEGDLVGPGWGATVLAATTEFAPSETRQEEDFFVAGLEWLEASGADVVNVSLGYSTFDGGEGDFSYADLDGNTTLVTRAVDRAAALGVVVVTSAGNEGDSSWRYLAAPADADSAIAVGAVRSDSSRTSFSSVGPTADGRTKPDVVALGSRVTVASSTGGYRVSGGTSFSSPAVAGVVAQILQVNPALGPVEVRDLLRRTASQSGAPDNERGWGVVNAAAAVEEARLLAGGEPAEAEPLAAALYPTLVPRGRRTLTVEIDSEAADRVTLSLYDVLGRRVAVLYDGPPRRGPVALPALAAGLYFYRFTGGALDADGRIVLL